MLRLVASTSRRRLAAAHARAFAAAPVDTSIATPAQKEVRGTRPARPKPHPL